MIWSQRRKKPKTLGKRRRERRRGRGPTEFLLAIGEPVSLTAPEAVGVLFRVVFT